MQRCAGLALLVVVAAGCVTTPDFLASGHDRDRHERDLAEAIKAGKMEKVRDTCSTPPEGETPPPPFNMIFKKWVNTKTQQAACDALQAGFVDQVAKTSASATKAGGAACLAQAQAVFASTSRKGHESGDWETSENRQQALAPISEACIAAAEKQIAAGEHRQVFLAFLGHKETVAGAVLTPDQTARASAVLQAAWKGAAAAYDKSAEQAASKPLARALFLAAKATVLTDAGDPGAADAVAAARAQLAGAPADKVSVAVSGSGLADDVAKLLVKRTIPDVVFDKAGALRLELELSAPELKTATDEVELRASYEVPKGTRINSNWVNQNTECQRHQRDVIRHTDECRRGAQNCSFLPMSERSVNECQEKLARIQKDVPTFEKKSAPYSATRYSGSARGTLAIRASTKEDTATEKVGATIERHSHQAVPVADVSAQSAKPVTEAELQAQYRSSAANLIADRLRAKAEKRVKSLLKTAQTAKDAEAAEALVAYSLRNPPEDKVVAPIGERLEMSARHTLRVLFPSR